MSRKKTVTPEQRKQYLAEWRAKNKEKWNSYSAKWYANNKEKRRSSMALWEDCNKEKARARRKKWRDAHKEQRATKQRLRLLGYKTLVVAAYGGGCSCCGEKRIGFLTVEHIKKNGKEHRRTVGGNFYNYLVKNNFPKEDLSILCMNCNWIERKGSLCPHKTEALAQQSL